MILEEVDNYCCAVNINSILSDYSFFVLFGVQNDIDRSIIYFLLLLLYRFGFFFYYFLPTILFVPVCVVGTIPIDHRLVILYGDRG